MRIVQLTNDNREIQETYTLEQPWFGFAPQALLDGFALLPEHEIHVVSCTRQETRNPEMLADNIWFHSLNIPKWGMLKSAYLPCIQAVRRKLRDLQPDVVHGQGTERDCAMCAVHSGFPNVLTIHGNMRVHASRPATASMYYRMAAILESYCLRRTIGVVAISTYTKNLVSDLAKNTWLVPNAVDMTFFDAIPSAETSNIPRLLFVGALNERKNPLAIVEATYPLLSKGQLRLAFAGDGSSSDPYFLRLKKMVADLPTVSFLGFLNRRNLRTEFENSSAFILPTFEDNCPMVVLEAQAAGVPVAASNVGGIPDLIENGKTGLLFDPKEPADISQAIHSLLDNQFLRQKLAAAGKEHALRSYHPKNVAERHIEIYHEVMGE